MPSSGCHSGPRPTAERRKIVSSPLESDERSQVQDRGQRPLPYRVRDHGVPLIEAQSSSLPLNTNAGRLQPKSSRLVSSATQTLADDNLECVVMAIDIKGKGNIGCAYYLACEQRLCCMDDYVNGGCETIESLILEIQPTTVLLSSSSDARLSTAEVTWRDIPLIRSDDSFNPLPYERSVRPVAEFSFEGGLNGLCSLNSQSDALQDVHFVVPGDANVDVGHHWPDELGMTRSQGNMHRLSMWVNLENRITIGCAGAVISYLQRKMTMHSFPDNPIVEAAWGITHVDTFSLQGSMYELAINYYPKSLIPCRKVDTDTLAALQIIQTEPHPITFNQSSSAIGGKESPFVYGLFNSHTKTPQGKATLRTMFLRPTLDLDTINERLDFISVFVRPANQELCNQLSKSLVKIKNMRTTITLLHKGLDGRKKSLKALKTGVWVSVLEFCYHAIDIADLLQQVVGSESLPFCIRAANVLDRFRFRQIGRMVHETVDLEASANEHRTVANQGINDDLDQVKSLYDGMEDILSKKAFELTQANLQTLGAQLHVVYFPHLGFHISIPLTSRSDQQLQIAVQNLGWQQMFVTNNKIYFKDRAMREMDTDLGDLYTKICDYEIDVAYDLARKILENEDLLTSASDLCGELDSLLAFVYVARQLNLQRPEMSEENVIAVIGGRHLLHELHVPSFVPNSTFLQGGSGDTASPSRPCMLMLTGPNYSGKSVYQKQVAIIVFLAHIGSFIPASSATIGITDRILARCTGVGSASRLQSTFLIDLQQITMAINCCSRRSLLIIDEFGKGTDACDGAGLAAGVLCHLLSRGTEAPKVLAASHYHDIFDLGLFDTFDNIVHNHMQIQLMEKAYRPPKTYDSEVIYLYNLCPGRSDTSFGSQCAAANGIPWEVVKRASILSRLSKEGEDLVTICSAIAPEEEEVLKAAEATARLLVAMDFRAWPSKNDLIRVLDKMLHTS